MLGYKFANQCKQYRLTVVWSATPKHNSFEVCKQDMTNIEDSKDQL